MKPTISMERSARHRTGLLSISSSLVSGARLTPWRLPLDSTKRQNTDTKKAPGEMDSTVAPSRGTRPLAEYQHVDPPQAKGARSQTKETTTKAVAASSNSDVPRIFTRIAPNTLQLHTHLQHSCECLHVDRGVADGP